MQWTIKSNGDGTFVIVPPQLENIMSKPDLSKLIVAFRQVVCGELDDGNEGIIVLPTIELSSCDVR